MLLLISFFSFFFFFFNDTAPTEIYTLSLHDALPIFDRLAGRVDVLRVEEAGDPRLAGGEGAEEEGAVGDRLVAGDGDRAAQRPLATAGERPGGGGGHEKSSSRAARAASSALRAASGDSAIAPSRRARWASSRRAATGRWALRLATSPWMSNANEARRVMSFKPGPASRSASGPASFAAAARADATRYGRCETIATAASCSAARHRTTVAPSAMCTAATSSTAAASPSVQTATVPPFQRSAVAAA